jgi:hypothetical protein
VIGYDELEASIAAVYDAQLSIPPWWPAEERHTFIDEMAGQATCLVMTELDDIVDRIIDQADPATSSDAIAAAITAEQHALLTEVRTTVLYDLTDAIADKSADLTAEAVFAHPRRRGPLSRLSGVRRH